MAIKKLLPEFEHRSQSPIPPRQLAARLALIVLVALASASVALALEPKLPILPGQYAFRHKFSEQPDMQSIPLVARISGRHIILINEVQSSVFPKGVIAEGTLMWHAKSGQWIIGEDESDRQAEDVGGCSDGPDVVDLEHQIYWTC
jgi:hypothetical protein